MAQIDAGKTLEDGQIPAHESPQIGALARRAGALLQEEMIVHEQTIEQDVWYDVDRERFVLSGLGATPGRFEGRVTPERLVEPGARPCFRDSAVPVSRLAAEQSSESSSFPASD